MLTNLESKWLQLNGNTRTFSGTPEENDVGSVKFQLVAMDNSGTTNMDVLLIVANQDGPQTNPEITSMFFVDGRSGYGPFSFLAGSMVSVVVNAKAFRNTNTDTQYYAVSGDNTPLPAWLIFHPESLSFSGSIPASTSPSQLPQLLDLKVIATNIPGYAEAVYKLQLMINIHGLTFTTQQINVSVIEGQSFSTDLKNYLQLDTSPIDPGLIARAETEALEWIELNRANLIFSGTPPKEFVSGLFNVSITDVYGDEAKTMISLTVEKTQQLLSSSLPQISAVIGGNLLYTLPSDIFMKEGLDISLDLSNCSTWLKYDAISRTLSGHIPLDLIPGTKYITLKVGRGSEKAEEQIPLIITQKITSTKASEASITSATSHNPSPSQSQAPTEADRSSYDNKSTLLKKIMFPIAGAAVLLIALMLFCVWRKKRAIWTPKSVKDEAMNGKVFPLSGTYGSRKLSPHTRLDSLDQILPDTWGQLLTQTPPSKRNSQYSANRRILRRPTSVAVAPSKIGNGTRMMVGADFGWGLGIGHGISHGTAPNGASNPSRQSRFTPMLLPEQSHTRNINPANQRTAPPKIRSIAELKASAMQRGRFPVVVNAPSDSQSQPTIRQVKQSPSPSEIPSPDLYSSPRARLNSFVHYRAAGRKESGFFSSAPAQRNVEREIMELKELDPKNLYGNNLPFHSRSSALRSNITDEDSCGTPAKSSSIAARLPKFTHRQSNDHNSTDTVPREMSNIPSTSPSAQYESEGDWVDDVLESDTPRALSWSKASQDPNNSSSHIAIVSDKRLNPSREVKGLDYVIRNSATLYADNSDLGSSSRNAGTAAVGPRRSDNRMITPAFNLRTAGQRPVSVEKSEGTLARDNRRSKSFKADHAFP